MSKEYNGKELYMNGKFIPPWNWDKYLTDEELKEYENSFYRGALTDEQIEIIFNRFKEYENDENCEPLTQYSSDSFDFISHELRIHKSAIMWAYHQYTIKRKEYTI